MYRLLLKVKRYGLFLIFFLFPAVLFCQDMFPYAMQEQASLRSFDLKKQYSGPVYALTFTGNEKNFFSAGVDTRIHYWDFFAAKDTFQLTGHTATITCLYYLKNGRLISASNDGLIKLWDIIKRKEIRTFTEAERVEQVISFQTTAAALTGSAQNEGLTRDKIKEMKSKEMIEKGKGGTRSNVFSESMSNKKEVFRPYINTIDVTKDNLALVSGDSRGLIVLWDVQKGMPQKTFYGHKKQVNVVCFHPKRKLFASASDDGTIILWDYQSLDTKKSKTIKEVHDGAKVTALVYSPDGRYLVSGGEDNLIKLRLFREKDTPVFQLEGHESTITKLMFTKNGKYLISASLDNTIRIWDVDRLKIVKIYAPRFYPVTNFALSPTENFILSSGRTDIASIRLWKLNYPIKEYEKQYK